MTLPLARYDACGFLIVPPHADPRRDPLSFRLGGTAHSRCRNDLRVRHSPASSGEGEPPAIAGFKSFRVLAASETSVAGSASTPVGRGTPGNRRNDDAKPIASGGSASLLPKTG